MSDRHTVYRVCPFCEATCGLAIEVESDSIVTVRGDKEDPFSRGFICPKAYGLKELYHDPDRLRRPVRRTANGWEEISWDEAYKEAASRLLAIREKYGNNAIGMYMGNPIVHDLAFLYLPILARALASRSVFNASAIDTLPKEVQTGLMFGGPFPLLSAPRTPSSSKRRFPVWTFSWRWTSTSTRRRVTRTSSCLRLRLPSIQTTSGGSTISRSAT